MQKMEIRAETELNRDVCFPKESTNEGLLAGRAGITFQ